MGNYIRYSAKNIAEEDFEIEYKGYKCEEVDLFLEGICEDYKAFEDMIKSLKKENEKLSQELKESNEKFSTIESLLADKNEIIKEFSLKNSSMADIVARLAEVENNQKNSNK